MIYWQAVITMEFLLQILILCALLFLAGLIDGVSGGGGIISFPAYLLVGLPLPAAYGCNKLQSCLGTATALVRYAKSGLVDLKAAIPASVTALLASHIATRVLLSMSDGAVKVLVAVCMVFLVVLTVLVGRLKSGSLTKLDTNAKTVTLCLVVGFVLGLYDGFFGPGGGTVALMLFTLVFGFDMRVASGNGKVVIVVSNLIALVSHISQGNVWWKYAIPATLANMLGCYIGAVVSVKKGAGVIKKLMVLVVIVVLIQAIGKFF